jgi:hypothetical protein
MPKPIPIALLVMLAVAFTIVVPTAEAATTHRHSRAHAAKTGKATGKATGASRTRVRTAAHSTAAHGIAVHGTATHGPSHASRPAHMAIQPRSRAALRAHARIRADIARRRRHGRLAPLPAELRPVHLSIPPPLRGSHESLVRQNEMAEAEGLERILDDADLDERIAHGSLVPVPVSATLRINPELPENRRYCRPWTAAFLSDLARAHAARFGESPLEVTSAVRTVEYQRQLRHINGNAAAADGDIASPHLTGSTIDIAKQGLSAREIGWMRGFLIPLEQAGKIDVEEEFRQSCFHISVYKSYAESKPASRSPAKTAPLASGSMLAAHGK